MATKEVKVVGGGLAGLAAAIALARKGVRVTLQEQARELGGRDPGVGPPATCHNPARHLVLAAEISTWRQKR